MARNYLDDAGLSYLVGKLKGLLAGHTNLKNNPHGVTAAQTGAVPTTRKVNGKALSEDITLAAIDVGAAPEAFYVTLGGNETDGYTLDKTFEEISAAYFAGKRVVLLEYAYGSILEYALRYVYSDQIDFSYHNGVNHITFEIYNWGTVTRKRFQYYSTQNPPSYNTVGAEPTGAVSTHNSDSSAHSGVLAPFIHSQAASTITAGTLGGKVNANATAAATLSNAQVRDIYAGTGDMTAGSSSLTTGTLYFVYE